MEPKVKVNAVLRSGNLVLGKERFAGILSDSLRAPKELPLHSFNDLNTITQAGHCSGMDSLQWFPAVTPPVTLSLSAYPTLRLYSSNSSLICYGSQLAVFTCGLKGTS